MFNCPAMVYALKSICSWRLPQGIAQFLRQGFLSMCTKYALSILWMAWSAISTTRRSCEEPDFDSIGEMQGGSDHETIEIDPMTTEIVRRLMIGRRACAWHLAIKHFLSERAFALHLSMVVCYWTHLVLEPFSESCAP